VAFDTIEWESGADLDPEFVYKKGKEQNQTLVVPREIRIVGTPPKRRMKLDNVTQWV